MPDSLFKLLSLPSLLDGGGIGQIAGRLGEPEQSVQGGMQLAVGAVLNGLLNRSNEPGALREVVELASKTPADGVTKIISALDESNSALVSAGKRFLSSIFESNESKVANAIGTASGLGTSKVSTLLATVAPLILGALGRRVRDGGLTAPGLSDLLQKESVTIRRALPSSLSSLLGGPKFAERSGVVTERIIEDPVVGQTVIKEKTGGSFWTWLIPLLVILGLLIWWFVRRTPPPSETSAPAVVQTTAPAAANLGEFVKRKLPDNVELNIPERGVEGRLLALIQDPSKAPDTTSWFDFDRLLFDTNSTALRPESQEQLNNVAEILKAYPNVHIKVGGYTDNTGDAAQNLKLSQGRADSVVAGLTSLGIAADRLEAKGYGEQYPVGDNATEEGRAKNRRVSMLVTQK